MYVLIGGAGMMGLRLAQQLLELGHTVAVIDKDPLACRFAREQIGVMAFEGSAVSTAVLLETGIRQANAVVAALRDDALNLALITLSKGYGIAQLELLTELLFSRDCGKEERVRNQSCFMRFSPRLMTKVNGKFAPL